MQTSEKISEIAKAMSAAQKAMRPASYDKTNPHFRSKYSSFASIWESVRAPLSDNGLSVFQDVTTCADGVSIVTRLMHNSGEWIEFGPFVLPVNKRDAQGVGSACTYGKRYALCAALGIVSDDDTSDDDGHRATQTAQNQQETQQVITIKINEYQYNTLMKLLSECDDEWVEKLSKHIFEKMKIKFWRELPAGNYDLLIQHINAYLQKKNAVENEGVSYENN